MYRRQRVETQKLTHTHIHMHRETTMQRRESINLHQLLEPTWIWRQQQANKEKNTADRKRLVLEIRFRSVVFFCLVFYCLLYVNTTLSKDYVIECNWAIDWVFKNEGFFVAVMNESFTERFNDRFESKRFFKVLESGKERSVTLKLIRASSTPFLLHTMGKSTTKKISQVSIKNEQSHQKWEMYRPTGFIWLKNRANMQCSHCEVYGWTC